MAIQSKLQLEKYQYGIDVQKTRQLYGMSGKVLYLARWISQRTDSIIIVEMNEIIAKHEAFFYRELNGHDHIIQTFGYVENDLKSTIFVQEYAQRGDLANLIMDNEIRMSQGLLMEIFCQITDAMSYVSSKSIVHGDLGCRNVLVYRIDSSNPKDTLVKLTDFGLARALHHPEIANEDTSIIPIRYCAPEILQDNNSLNYSEKSDVYSMGVLMWEALSNGEMPYSSIASDDVVRRKKLNDKTLYQPVICDRQLWILMGTCWTFQPDQRINFEQMKEQLADINIIELTDTRLSISTYQLTIPLKFKLDIDVRMKECLNGSYGKTYNAEWLSRVDRPIVLIQLDKPPTDYELLFYTELHSHPHLIHNFGFVENDLQSLILLQERALHGNLQLLLEHKRFQPSTAVLVEIFSQIVEAMIYITGQNLVHGDLRCANVLVFQMDESIPKENLVKLTNFSSAHRNDPKVIKERRSIIPARYCALEIVRSAGQSNYSELSDVYSMGVLMWEACSHGQVPYASSMLNSKVRQRKLNDEKLIKPWLCNEQIWSIMEDCWYNEPSLRYDFSQMKIRLSHVNLELEKTYRYELNVDVQMGEQLHGKFGKKFYQAEWITKKDPSIILLTFDEPTARNEVPFYFQLNSNRHIVHTLGLVKNKLGTTILVQERALHGNLKSLLRENQFQPSGNVLVKIFLQIIDAMIYMIDQKVIYGDLCCENVLVFRMHPSMVEENLVKLTNFHLARRDDSALSDKQEKMIPVRYCAPELLQNSDRSNASELADVYSMGVLMWEGCSKGDVPYGSDTSDDDVRQRRLNNERLSRPNECDQGIWSVIESCWCSEPQLRYDFRGLRRLLSNIRLSQPAKQSNRYDVPIPPKAQTPVPTPSRPPTPLPITIGSKTTTTTKPLATPPPSESILGRVRSIFRNMFKKKKELNIIFQ